ncbi:MAG TPA: malto-oligosyltrehalose synthase [Mycobacteriales bacterium]|nr:malto-oligosyltrehalose synthase [Mycobacteriales bacterium]
MSRSAHRLGSTYRLQLNGLGFAAAAELVPFLHDLGVETCYLSPIATAMPSSSHGYDGIDPNAVDPSLGGADGLEQMLSALATHEMSALIDIVPNHLAANPANRYFRDLLRHGRRSPYAAWFDVNWERGARRIVLPVLDGSLPEVIRRGTLRVERAAEDGGFALRLGETRYPIADAGPGDDDLPVLLELAGADPRNDRAVARQIELLESRQHYRLVDWRAAGREINYRRFFAINDLIGIRQEDPVVFEETHRLVAALAADHRVAGFRVDHVDGLRDPTTYLQRLRDLVDANGVRHVITVEKILARDEALPPWPVDGTTGYEAAAAVTGVLIDPAGFQQVADEQAAASGDHRGFHDRAVEAKLDVLRTMFAGSVDDVLRALAAAGVTEDVDQLRSALEALSANLGVYRTYRRERHPMRPEDLGRVQAAAAAARSTLPAECHAALAAALAVMSSAVDDAGGGARAAYGWQQLTSAAMAKGVEDQASFDAGRLLAVCEVGVDPDRATWSPSEWHEQMQQRAGTWPRAMTAGSTHDSKRSLDVRCRLAALSELGPSWTEAVARLDVIPADGRVDAAARRYLYQTAVAAWPIGEEVDESFLARLGAHLDKASREAGIHSSWTAVDEEYEAAYRELAAEVVRGPGRDIVLSLVERVAAAGASNSLAAVVLGATAPGVPDVYQGDDLWFQALTDPDNRRAVDWARHRDALTLHDSDPRGLLDTWRTGRIKQLVLSRCLQLRRRLGEWWDLADYDRLDVRGPAAAHVVAYARSRDGISVVTVVPRLPLTLAGAGAFPCGEIWGSTDVVLPETVAGWRDALTDREVVADAGRIRLSDLLDQLPVAVLHPASPAAGTLTTS